ncbi:cytochrome b5-like heme/steroid binding domain-containing protein [Schizophyllum commune]
MQAENPNLLPPKDDPFTLEELRAFDGTDPARPIYVSIKGTVFDVSPKRDVYGPGRSYGLFAGKDASKGLGMSSLRPEHAVPDYAGLSEGDRKVLDDWWGFFSKRYNIVGRVVDHPTHLREQAGGAPTHAGEGNDSTQAGDGNDSTQAGEGNDPARAGEGNGEGGQGGAASL